MKKSEIIKDECSGILKYITDNLDTWIIVLNKDRKILWYNKPFINILSKCKIKNALDKSIDSIPFFKSSTIEKKCKICILKKQEIKEDARLKISNKNYSVSFELFPFRSEKLNEDLVIGLIKNKNEIQDMVKEYNSLKWFQDNIFNNIRVYGIITTDKNFIIERFNKGASLLFEYSSIEAVGKLNIKKMFTKRSLVTLQEIIDALKILSLIRREVEMKNHADDVITVDLTVSKLVGAHKAHIGYVFIASDMTEQKKLKISIEKQNIELARLYHETQKANKAKSIFLANMSHEFRTPLTAILGFSELLLDNKVGNLGDSQKEFLNDIYVSGKHLLTLINDVLDLSKIEAEQLEIHMEKVCVNDILNSAKTFIVPTIKKKNLKIIDNIPGKRIWVEADESRLKQTIYNIYSNAAKFTGNDGKIITTVLVKNKEVVISIKDTGIGIRKEYQDIIFEEFLQIENPYSKKYTGTGLGLALVKRFVKMMNGKISVFSKGEGKGAAFTVSFPIYKSK